jgi:hypothetical protein
MQATLQRHANNNSSSRWSRARSRQQRVRLIARAAPQIKVGDTCTKLACLCLDVLNPHTLHMLLTGRGRRRPRLSPCGSAMGQRGLQSPGHADHQHGCAGKLVGHYVQLTTCCHALAEAVHSVTVEHALTPQPPDIASVLTHGSKACIAVNTTSQILAVFICLQELSATFMPDQDKLLIGSSATKWAGTGGNLTLGQVRCCCSMQACRRSFCVTCSVPHMVSTADS